MAQAWRKASAASRYCSAPQPVRLFGHDGPAVGPISVDVLTTMRREKAAFAHQPQHAVLARTDPTRSKPDSDLAMALAQKRARAQHVSDGHEQFLIAPTRSRAALVP